MVVTKKSNVESTLGLFFGYFLIALGISPLTTTMFPQIGNLIEPFLLAGVVFVNKYGCSRIPFKDVFLNNKCLLLIIVLLIFSIIGMFTPSIIIHKDNDGILKLVYADFRSCFLFGYSMLLFTKVSQVKIHKRDLT